MLEKFDFDGPGPRKSRVFIKMDPNYEGKMLGNESLSDEDIWSILAFIKSVWPEDIVNKYDAYFDN